MEMNNRIILREKVKEIGNPTIELARIVFRHYKTEMPDISHEIEMPSVSYPMRKYLEVFQLRADMSCGNEISTPITAIDTIPPLPFYAFIEHLGIKAPYVEEWDDDDGYTDFGNHVHIVIKNYGKLIIVYNTFVELLPWFAPFFAGKEACFRESIQDWAGVPSRLSISSLLEWEGRNDWAVTPNNRHGSMHIEIRIADAHPIESWVGACLIIWYALGLKASPKNYYTTRQDNYYRIYDDGFNPYTSLEWKNVRPAPGVMEEEGEYTIKEVITKVYNVVKDKMPPHTRVVVDSVVGNILAGRKVYYHGFRKLYGDLVDYFFPNFPI